MSNNNDTNTGHNANDGNDGNTNKPTSAMPEFLQNTPVDQDYLDDLAQSAVDEIGDLDLRSFMAHVMVEIEPWEVLTLDHPGPWWSRVRLWGFGCSFCLPLPCRCAMPMT